MTPEQMREWRDAEIRTILTLSLRIQPPYPYELRFDDLAGYVARHGIAGLIPVVPPPMGYYAVRENVGWRLYYQEERSGSGEGEWFPDETSVGIEFLKRRYGEDVYFFGRPRPVGE